MPFNWTHVALIQYYVAGVACIYIYIYIYIYITYNVWFNGVYKEFVCLSTRVLSAVTSLWQ
ncbi:hypothetical protein ACMBCM_08655, partial [Spiroplasma sp. K1]